MATVLERFNKLGLASSNSVLSAAGAWVSEAYRKEHHIYSPPYMSDDNDERNFVYQTEPDGKTYTVYNYPDHWTNDLDQAIFKFINQNEKKEEETIRPKRKRIQRNG